MEALLKKMKKDLGGLLIEGKKSKDEEIKAAIMLIYNSSKVMISKVADNVARGQILQDDDVTIMEKPQRVPLPDCEEWEFELGDTVKIKLPRDDFKWMQRETLGWRSDLNQLVGQIGIVTNVACKYENSIGVYFPDVYTGCLLYAGVLEKVPPRQDIKLLCRWKPGDYVKTTSPPKVLHLLQRGLEQIPDKYTGKKGKVVYVTHPCVIVTFDGKRTFDFKSSSLVPCNDDDVEFKKEEIIHARGFKVGDEVKIISNLKKLIENQKEHGNWNSSMTPIKGQKARVINIQKDGSLNIQTKHNRAWRVNSESVLLPGDEELEAEDLKLLPGSIVKVLVPRNIRSILAMAGVPSVFLEYLRTPALLAFVDDDFDYFIRFNHEQNVQTCKEIIQKATTSETEAYEKVQGSKDNLKVGDQVHLDIGPPNFVRYMIAEMNLSQQVQTALTKHATLIGYTSPYTAVIKYEDGSRFRVKTKFLTVPEKFHIDENKYSISVETMVAIKEVISRSIQDLHSREGAPTDDWEVHLINLREGNPPCLEFKIKTTLPKFKSIVEWLKENSGWTIESLCDGQLIVRGAEKSNDKLEVKIWIIFNEETSEFEVKEQEATTETGVISEGPSSRGNKTQPFNTEDPPIINSLQQFKYLCLYDADLAQNVYFPYVIQGNRRTPTRPVTDAVRPPPPPYREENNYTDNA